MQDLTGQVIKGYELRELIEVGGFGAVYRAYQAVVNREVAIKVILPQYANHPEFIRRFETEAQLIARLEHLHIVPIYDFWREPDSAYLVMRWLKGGNLHLSLAGKGYWSLTETARLLDQIAAALTVAHRKGVIHQDLKPANILLDEEENAYLADFGIAKDLFDEQNAGRENPRIGTPLFMAPEQFTRDREISAQTDIYSLGILVYTILTGRVPFTHTKTAEVVYKQINEPLPPLQLARPDLPRELNLVLRRATAKISDVRYPDALSMAADFHKFSTALEAPQPAIRSAVPENIDTVEGIHTLVIDTRILEPQNPYKGLRPFDEADSADFFGRESVVERLLNKMEAAPDDNHFLAVVGPSGSGKSSLVRAGLMPLVRDGHLGNSDEWFIAKMVPGAEPFRELEAALLRVARDAYPNLYEQLVTDDHGLATAVSKILVESNTEMLLVIDQFEEVFTLVEDEAYRARFIRNLYHAITDEKSPFRLIIMLRADFYDRPLLYSGFGDLVRDNTEVVLPLTSSELVRAILQPAERVGLTVEPGLVAAITGDLAQQPGVLPLLQYTLTELFEKRDGLQLTLSAYEKSGGVMGALARRAEDLYEQLDEQRRSIARQLFLRLVAVSDQPEATRRRVRWADLGPIIQQYGLEEVQSVLDAFGRYRLLTFDHDPQTRAPTVEVAHEALIREWNRLQTWLDESRETLLNYRRLVEATAEWTGAGRDPSFLATGSRLVQLEGLDKSMLLSQDESDYLGASVMLRQRAAYRIRLIIVGLAIFSLVALALAIFAFDQQAQTARERDRADEQARVSFSRELASTALTNIDELDLSLLLSLEALRVADTFEARNSLLNGLQAKPYLVTHLQGHTDRVRTVAVSPDGDTAASGSRDGQIFLWNTHTGHALMDPLSGHEGAVNRLAFSPDGTLLASAGADGTALLWDVQSGQPVGVPLAGHDGPVWGIEFSPDGRILVSSGEDGTLRLWDVQTNTEIREFQSGHEDIVFVVRFSPDGTLIASGGADNAIHLFDVVTGEQIGSPLTAHTNWVLDLAFTASGQQIASSGADTTLILWDIATQQALAQAPTGHTGWVRSVSFSPNGQWLMTASEDNQIRLWNAETGQLASAPLDGHNDAVWGAVFAADNHTVVSGGADNAVLLWDIAQATRLAHPMPPSTNAISSLAFNADGTSLVAASYAAQRQDDSIQYWLLASDGQTLTRADHALLETENIPLTLTALSKDGSLLATGSADHTIRLWRIDARATTGSRQQSLQGTPFGDRTEGTTALAFSDDNSLLAAGTEEGRVLIWTMTDEQQIGHLPIAHGDGVLSLAFSPDEKILASGDRSGTVILWDIAALAPLGQPLTGHTDAVTSIVFSMDGKTIATGSRDGTVILWDASTGQPLMQPLAGHLNWVLDLAISPDGSLLASGSRDGTVILWDAGLGRELGTPLASAEGWVSSIAMSPDGTILASGGTDQSVQLWNVGLAAWRQQACSRANRNLTAAEWERFFQGEPYHQTCLIP